MSTHLVKIYYGPCDSYHTVSHRPQKLRGLRDQLRRRGYRVNMQPINFIDFCVIEMCGHEVFRCNVNYLSFNTPCGVDATCARAVDAVLDATDKFNSARTYLWTWTAIGEQLFKRSDYAPTDYWAFDVNFQPFSLECVNCCGIHVRKKTDEELGEETEEGL